MAQLHSVKPKKLLIGLGVSVLCLVVSLAYLVLQNQSSFTITRADGEELSQASLSASEAGKTNELSSTSSASANEEAGTSSRSSTSQLAPLVVHIDGAVQNPGVYTLTVDARCQDAVIAAGGLTEKADTTTINLAQKLTDGQKIHIPAQGEAEISSAASAVQAERGTDASSGLVNINTASAAELDTLPGVGEALAAAIIQDREEVGPFASIEDLMRVSGIGEKKYAKLESYICV